jgi:hypothetical protein
VVLSKDINEIAKPFRKEECLKLDSSSPSETSGGKQNHSFLGILHSFDLQNLDFLDSAHTFLCCISPYTSGRKRSGEQGAWVSLARSKAFLATPGAPSTESCRELRLFVHVSFLFLARKESTLPQ